MITKLTRTISIFVFLWLLSINCYALSSFAPQFVAIGSNQTILTSSDGANWIPQTGGLKWMESIAYGNNHFVALGNNGVDSQALISHDEGTSWTSQIISLTFPPTFNIIWHNNQYIGINVSAGSTISTSADGLTWYPRYSGDSYSSAAASNTTSPVYVAVGGVSSDHSCQGYLAISSDGMSWNKVSQNLPCFGMSHAWDSKSLQNSYPIYHVTRASITWGNNQFVATGQKGGSSDAYEAGLLTSADGQNWSWHSVGTQKLITSVTWGNNMFVAVGQDLGQGTGLVFTSPDGSNWDAHLLGVNDRLFKIIWKNNLFVAVGNNGIIVTSPDATHWKQQKSGTTNTLLDVA